MEHKTQMLSGIAHFDGLSKSTRFSWQDSAGQESSPRLAGPTNHPLGPRRLATLWRWEVRGAGWCGERWWERNTKYLGEGMERWWENIRLKAPRRKKGWPASRSFLTFASQTLLLLLLFMHYCFLLYLLLLHFHLHLLFQLSCLSFRRHGICLFQESRQR